MILILSRNEKAVLAIHDPPYNFIAFDELDCTEFFHGAESG
jgi:hypothetical protein